MSGLLHSEAKSLSPRARFGETVRAIVEIDSRASDFQHNRSEENDEANLLNHGDTIVSVYCIITKLRSSPGRQPSQTRL